MQDSFSKQLYETMRDRSMCNDPNQNPVGVPDVSDTEGQNLQVETFKKLHAFPVENGKVLHVWFARDKGANYGFCEIASQEEHVAGQEHDGWILEFCK